MSMFQHQHNVFIFRGVSADFSSSPPMLLDAEDGVTAQLSYTVSRGILGNDPDYDAVVLS